MRQEMSDGIDLYTKVYLTMIAVSLLVIATKDIIEPAFALLGGTVAVCDTKGKRCADIHQGSVDVLYVKIVN